MAGIKIKRTLSPQLTLQAAGNMAAGKASPHAESVNLPEKTLLLLL